MSDSIKPLSNSFSTGGGGAHFEAHVQALYVSLMLTGGFAPFLPCWPITEIKLQGKVYGFETDDFIVILEDSISKSKRKMLGQIKHSISFTAHDKEFQEVIQAAWSDFNNPNVFTRDNDIIALITGPLSKTDFQNVQWLIDQAVKTKDYAEFYSKVERANFSPPKAIEKLHVISDKLKVANNNVEPSKEMVYTFLNHFRVIGYDLGNYGGVIKPLVYSHISMFNKQYPQHLWASIVEFVHDWNIAAGTITLEKLPFELKKEFAQLEIVTFPISLAKPQHEPKAVDWNQHQHATLLALLNLIGSWDENNENDIGVVSEIVGGNYTETVLRIRELLQSPESPLDFKNGIWKIIDRNALWNDLAKRVFNNNLEVVGKLAVAVLTEHDPAFELPSNKRFTAKIYGKKLTYSKNIRNGLAESLALSGNFSSMLENSSPDYGRIIANKAIHDIFANSTWELWGSLNQLLPILAEAAPNEFLASVEKSLTLETSPFDKLFANEDNSILGNNYITGLLWALESLAWDEQYLVRVCAILGELASRDPGGKWANRPANSLTMILLPWIKHTTASIKKRMVAVRTLCTELPDVAWQLLITLLPNKNQWCTGTYKPVWRKIIPDDLDQTVTSTEYWEQEEFYSELAIEQAGNDLSKLNKLVSHLDNLPRHALEHFLSVLSSEPILKLSEDQRFGLWNSITKLLMKHTRYSNEVWSLKGDVLSSIKLVADKLSPNDPFYLYRNLFTNKVFELYDSPDNYEESEKKLNGHRRDALEEMLSSANIEKIIDFSRIVESPYTVGFALGIIQEWDYDSFLLPHCLIRGDDKLASFMDGYVNSRSRVLGIEWVDQFQKCDWSPDEVGLFLGFLPFKKEVWDRVSEWLGELQKYYWSIVNVRPQQSENDLNIAIEKLLQFGRPNAAIYCLHILNHLNKPIEVSQCARALSDALMSSEPSHTFSNYDAVDIIQFLQASPGFPSEEMFKIEFAYLPLLDGTSGARPKTLEHHLAENPESFCEVVRLVYRSDKLDSAVEKGEKATEYAKTAWELLYNWTTPPGTQKDGSFDGAHYQEWLDRVKLICFETGHLDVALTTVGGVLIYAPSDIDGLWINHYVADSLNAKDADRLRDGYRIGVMNSRGVHTFDPTGAPEFEIAEKYRHKAEEIENAGYYRFAVLLRSISDYYKCEAEQILIEHTNDVNTVE